MKKLFFALVLAALVLLVVAAAASATPTRAHLAKSAGATRAWAPRNSGACWTTVPSGTTARFNDLSLVDATHAWAVGAGGLVRFWSGSSWSAPGPAPTAEDLHAVDFIDDSEGWAVGGGGVILHTSDGGATWQTQTSGTSLPLHDVCFVDVSHGWAVGADTANDLGVILATANGGATWVPQTTNIDFWGNDFIVDHLSSISMSDAQNGVIVGDGWLTEAAPIIFLLRTSNGGATWEGTVSYPDLYNDAEDLDYRGGDVKMLSASDGFAAVWEYAHYYHAPAPYSNEMIFKTTDGGASWDSVFSTPVVSGNIPTSIRFADPLHAWVAGSGGEVIRTTDGGASWHLETLGLKPLSGLGFSDALNGFAVGAHGAIYRTANGWIDRTRPTTSAPLAVSAARGGTVTFRFKATDIDSPLVHVTITVRNAAGYVVARYDAGWKKTGSLRSYKHHCGLTPGTYRFTVVALDAAHNGQRKTGSNSLYVH